MKIKWHTDLPPEAIYMTEDEYLQFMGLLEYIPTNDQLQGLRSLLDARPLWDEDDDETN